MNDRRAQDLRRDGDRITDERAVAQWLNAMSPAPRTYVRRLSRRPGEAELPTLEGRR